MSRKPKPTPPAEELRALLTYDPDTGVLRWKAEAFIRANGKNIFIGGFPTALEAHEAYLERKRQLHQGCTI